jgi:hypothetical protein
MRELIHELMHELIYALDREVSLHTLAQRLL